MNIIDKFENEYSFLSNFYNCVVEYDEQVFNSSEAAFQAAKILYLDRKDTLEARRKFIGVSPSEAKKMGRHCDLRKDWDKVKDQVMLEIVRNKFSNNLELRQKLLETGDITLVEGTKWHDNYWGNCTCLKCKNIEGKNKLGLVLMKVRDELRH